MCSRAMYSNVLTTRFLSAIVDLRRLAVNHTALHKQTLASVDRYFKISRGESHEHYFKPGSYCFADCGYSDIGNAAIVKFNRSTLFDCDWLSGIIWYRPFFALN